MPAGFFGKLPAKRDFVASGASRAFLEMWEPWLQASLATSRQMLGDDWSAAYNRAPIWRFWLGAHFAGEAIIGALMASVDGVGRPFPMGVFCGEGDGLLPPPEIEANDAWCEGLRRSLRERGADRLPGLGLPGIGLDVVLQLSSSSSPRT